SSRRRHTRCYRDWSSDVCSSDLNGRRRGHIDKRNLTMATVCLAMGVVRLSMALEIAPWLWKRVRGSWKLNYGNFTFKLRTRRRRSEERRVGKECSCRRLPYHTTK